MNKSVGLKNGTEADATIPNLQNSTSLLDEITTFKGMNRTSTNKCMPIVPPTATMSTEEKPINYSKPWRQVIRRRVVDGRNDNES